MSTENFAHNDAISHDRKCTIELLCAPCERPVIQSLMYLSMFQEGTNGLFYTNSEVLTIYNYGDINQIVVKIAIFMLGTILA